MRNLIDIMDLSIEEIDNLIEISKDIIANPEKYQEKCRYKKLATLFFENIEEILFRFARAFHVLFVYLALVHKYDGQGILHLLIVRLGQSGKRAFRLVQRVVYRVEGKIPLYAQAFDEVGYVEIVLFKLGVVDTVFIEKYARRPAEHRFCGVGIEVEQAHDLVQKVDGEDRDKPVKEGNGGIAHRYAGEVGDDEGYDEFVRLHFADLAFAHQAHNDQERDENDDRSDKDKSHTISF